MTTPDNRIPVQEDEDFGCSIAEDRVSNFDPDGTPTPMASYVDVKEPIPAEDLVATHSAGAGLTARRITIATALVATLGAGIVTSRGEKQKTPGPPLVAHNGSPGEGGAGGSSPDAGADATESEKCTVDISSDGRPVREGTCVVVFALGEDTIYKARLEKARIMINSKNFEVEIDHGSVKGIAGKQRPDFLVRGSKHFLKAEMQIQGTIWVQDTENGKVATVRSDEGETLLETSWSAENAVVPEGEFRTFSLEAPAGEQPASCSLRWVDGKPEKDADAWLSMLGALAVMGLARRRSARSS